MPHEHRILTPSEMDEARERARPRDLAPTYLLCARAGVLLLAVAGVIFAFTEWTLFQSVMILLFLGVICGAFYLAYVRLVHLPTMHSKAEKRYREAEAKKVAAEAAALWMVPAIGDRQIVTNRRYNLAVYDHSEDRNVFKYDVAELAEQQAQLPAPHVRQPSARSLLAELEPNRLQVCPGVKADTGEPVILSIEDAVHFKLVGGSGFGKSCHAAAMLEQVTATNAPEVLQIALLDLEHKTSRLFEDVSNVAHLRVGGRLVPMVATSADEVARSLGYLKLELDRRARLSETDLAREPMLLIYVEELLALQYEVDEKLLARMLADLAVLAVRTRKYRMSLLACTQTDYSTPELRTAQKQFRTRIAYAIDVSAARAAGFQSTDLVKQNFAMSTKGDGRFVLESPGIAALMLAPVFDVKQKLLVRERSTAVLPPFTPPSMPFMNGHRTATERPQNGSQNGYERPSETSAAEVAHWHAMGWGKQAIIEKVWNVKKGGSPRYKSAEAAYESIINQQTEQET